MERRNPNEVYVLVGEMLFEGAGNKVKRWRVRKARGDQAAEEGGNKRWNSYERFGRGQGGDFRRDSIRRQICGGQRGWGRRRPRMTFFLRKPVEWENRNRNQRGGRNRAKSTVNVAESAQHRVY